MSYTRTWQKIVTAATVIALLTGLLAACSGAPVGTADGTTSQVDEIMRRGVLKVGLDIFVP